MTDDEINEILRHFVTRQRFRITMEHWDAALRELFCRLAVAIHNANLDLYHTNMNNELRFGRKNRDASGAHAAAGYIRFRQTSVGVQSNRRWTGDRFDSIEANKAVDLNSELIEDIESELEDWEGIPEALDAKRDGLWPDEYPDFAPDPDKKDESPSAEFSGAPSLNKILYGPRVQERPMQPSSSVSRFVTALRWRTGKRYMNAILNSLKKAVWSS